MSTTNYRKQGIIPYIKMVQMFTKWTMAEPVLILKSGIPQIESVKRIFNEIQFSRI